MTLLKFHDMDIEIIDINGKKWLRSSQIGTALELSKPESAVKKIYNRNKLEFSEDMTATVELPSSGGKQLTRIYSARGAALIAMKAQTPKAAEFRRWVLDVLETGNTDELTRLRLELAHVKECNRRMKSYILTTNTLWAKICSLMDIGVTNSYVLEILTKTPHRKFGENLSFLQRLGILPRPTLDGYVDGQGISQNPPPFDAHIHRLLGVQPLHNDPEVTVEGVQHARLA